MPSTSKKQRNFMAAAAHDPKFAKKVGVSQKVAKEFNEADKGKKFGTGGDVKYSYGGKNQANKQRTRFGSSFGYKLNAPDANNNKYAGLKEGGKVMKHDDIKEDKPMMKQIAGIEATKVVNKHEKKMHGMACGGKVKKMSAGGKARGCGIATKGLTKGKMV